MLTFYFKNAIIGMKIVNTSISRFIKIKDRKKGNQVGIFNDMYHILDELDIEFSTNYMHNVALRVIEDLVDPKKNPKHLIHQHNKKIQFNQTQLVCREIYCLPRVTSDRIKSMKINTFNRAAKHLETVGHKITGNLFDKLIAYNETTSNLVGLVELLMQYYSFNQDRIMNTTAKEINSIIKNLQLKFWQKPQCLHDDNNESDDDTTKKTTYQNMAKNLIHYNILYNFLQLSPDKTKYVLKKISKCKEHTYIQLVLNKLKIKKFNNKFERPDVENTVFKISKNLILKYHEVLDKLCLTSIDINNMIIKYIKSPKAVNQTRGIIKNITACTEVNFNTKLFKDRKKMILFEQTDLKDIINSTYTFNFSNINELQTDIVHLSFSIFTFYSILKCDELSIDFLTDNNLMNYLCKDKSDKYKNNVDNKINAAIGINAKKVMIDESVCSSFILEKLKV